MRLQLCFASLFAILFIPSDKGAAQVAPSASASSALTASPIASATARPVASPTVASKRLFYKPPGAAGNTLAIAANAGRVTITGIIADFKPELAEGLFHEAQGWVIFMVALVILILWHQILHRSIKFIAARRAS